MNLAYPPLRHLVHADSELPNDRNEPHSSASATPRSYRSLIYFDIITCPQPPAEIINHLTIRGCQDLTDDLDPSSISTQPVSHGGYGSVYLGKLRDGRQVAIKALRVPINDDDEAGRLPKVTMFTSSHTQYLCGY
ncbi:hypothetical protein FRC12_011859 [Ceratobasidium sp. 428]|nr:hypothetical protein FRC12_011859 [Ceratobasidium sp. 428]